MGLWVEGLKDLLLPRWCAACGAKLMRGEEQLCTACIRNMPLTYFWNQTFNPMADRLNARIQEHIAASQSGNEYEDYSFAVALFYYRGDYRKLSQSVKYNAALSLGSYLGRALGRKVSGCSFLSDVDVVIPVPLHKSRKWSRGYNQASVLAREVAVLLEAEFSEGWLKRRKRTRSQADISYDEKADNVSGAFCVDDGVLLPHKPAHLLLVDDVFTSGSTLCECHRAIRRALVNAYGAEEGLKIRISAATLAFVGE